MAENEKPVEQEKQTETQGKQKKQMSDKTRYILLGVSLAVCIAVIVLACVFLA